jgi:mannose-6-phosphate isomerase-like protein (cupin superfamily)
MRLASVLTFVATAFVALAQQKGQQRTPQPEKTFTSASEVDAMIAKARKERKPDQGNFIQPLLSLSPYRVNLESRVEAIDTPPMSHEAESEMIYVIQGAGVLTQGGKILDERRANATNLTGSRIEGGSPRRIVKGDFIFVPANVPHAFTKTEGTLVIMSVHLPKDGAGK